MSTYNIKMTRGILYGPHLSVFLSGGYGGGGTALLLEEVKRCLKIWEILSMCIIMRLVGALKNKTTTTVRPNCQEGRKEEVGVN